MIDFKTVMDAKFFEVPKFMLPIRDYTFSLTGLLTIAPIALVTIAEHIGDHMALSVIINKDLIKMMKDTWLIIAMRSLTLMKILI